MTSKQRPVSVGATTTFTDDNVAVDKQGGGCSQPDMSELTVVSRKPSSRDAEIPSPSGINWRFAHQGRSESHPCACSWITKHILTGAQEPA